MKRDLSGRRWLSLAALLLFSAGLVAALPHADLSLAAFAAETPDALDLSWWTLDGGGITSTDGGAYTAGGTLGQPDAGSLSGEDYVLTGGFWLAGAAAGHAHYLPLVLIEP